MASPALSAADRRRIALLVQHYQSVEVQEPVVGFLNVMRTHISESARLSPLIHTLRWRIKEANHLRDKLRRNCLEAKAKGTKFDVTPENLLVRVRDLAGVRILHLQTDQIREIDAGLRDVLKREGLRLLEKPFARTWDDESRDRFKSYGFKTEVSPTMYTSVHYVVGSSSESKVACEVQVRTLMEEVWGEVDHELNYPRPTGSLMCREQIRVLARVISSGTRLVDVIYATAAEHKQALRRKRARARKRG